MPREYGTGAITVFDFDNYMNCWHTFDLASLWIHNEGWTRQSAWFTGFPMRESDGNIETVITRMIDGKERFISE